MHATPLENELLDIRRTLGWMDLVLANISEAVCVVDHDWKIVFANDTFAALTEQHRVFLLGHKLTSAIKLSAKDTPLDDIIKKNRRSVKEAEALEGTYQCESPKTVLTLRLTARHVPTLKQTVILLHDITQQQELDHMRREFIALASHQLRTPLTAVSVYGNMLQDGYGGPLSEEQRHFMTNIVESAGRMHKLVNELLNISALDRGAVNLNWDNARVYALWQEILLNLKPQAKQKNIGFTIKCPKDLVIRTDDFRIKEVLSNLIMNAIQYSHNGGKIDIDVSTRGKYVTTVIKDYGIGIPESSHERLFSQFYRADNAVTHHSGGTGLGLYFVKLLVQQLRGKIWFESQEGIGTSFFLKLPITIK